MATILRASGVALPARAARSTRGASSRVAPVVRPRNLVLARSTPTEDPSAKLQEQLNDAVKLVQTKWDETADAEKPAAVAIIIGAIIVQIAIGATVDAVDRLPLIHQFLEVVGLAVVSVYGYRYVTDPAERDSVKKSLENFVDAVTGK